MKNKIMLKGRNIILTILLPFISFSIHAQTGFPIHSSSGAVSYGSDTIKTTGTVKATTIIAPNATFGGISVTGSTNTISVPGGTVGFGNSNLTTTGNVTAGFVTSDSVKIRQINPYDSIIAFGDPQVFLNIHTLTTGIPSCTCPASWTSHYGFAFGSAGSSFCNTVFGIGTTAPNATLNVQNCSASSSEKTFAITNGHTTPVDVFTVDNHGNTYTAGTLAINTSTIPSGYTVAINGSVIATDVYVALYGSWPDYVFDNAYKRRSLDELETYLNLNHHLPGMPSAADIKNKGSFSVSEVATQNTKQIEELTLDVIELNKEVKALEAENKKLLEQINKRK